MKAIRNLWNYLRPSIEGEDGKFSHRRASVFYFMALITYMVYKTAHGSVFPEIAWIVVAGGAGLMSGLSVWQNKVNREYPKFNEPTEPVG